MRVITATTVITTAVCTVGIIITITRAIAVTGWFAAHTTTAIHVHRASSSRSETAMRAADITMARHAAPTIPASPAWSITAVADWCHPGIGKG